VTPTPKSRERLEESLAQVNELLERHRLVEGLVHSQDSRRHDLVESLVQRQHLAELQSRLNRLHTADVAYILEALPMDARLLVWDQVRQRRGGDILLEVSDEVRESLIEAMERPNLIDVIDQLDADDLLYVADELPADILEGRIRSLDANERHWVRSSMAYPEDAVGHLMSHEMATVRADATLEHAIDELRAHAELPVHTDKLFVIDKRGHLLGVLTLPNLLLGNPAIAVSEVMATDVITFTPDDDAGEAAKAFERYDLASAPVVTERGRLLGRLTVDVMMDFVREETHEEVLNLAGLSGSEDLFSPLMESARNRWVWISLNMITAFVSSRVVGLFEGTIAHLVALATLMPIVAGIGGNTGNQTAALIIRGLALGQVRRGAIFHLVRKELSIGLMNGMVWGSVVSLFAFVLYHSLPLSLVIAAAMALELLIAALVGMTVPMTLHRLGRDPALGTGVLLTATTDSMGFFIFLGLAQVFLVGGH